MSRTQRLFVGLIALTGACAAPLTVAEAIAPAELDASVIDAAREVPRDATADVDTDGLFERGDAESPDVITLPNNVDGGEDAGIINPPLTDSSVD